MFGVCIYCFKKNLFRAMQQTCVRFVLVPCVYCICLSARIFIFNQKNTKKRKRNRKHKANCRMLAPFTITNCTDLSTNDFISLCAFFHHPKVNVAFVFFSKYVCNFGFFRCIYCRFRLVKRKRKTKMAVLLPII